MNNPFLTLVIHLKNRDYKGGEVPRLYCYCPTRGLGEKPSSLCEDFSLIFCATRVRGVEDSMI
jgi:hypothetical protein